MIVACHSNEFQIMSFKFPYDLTTTVVCDLLLVVGFLSMSHETIMAYKLSKGINTWKKVLKKYHICNNNENHCIIRGKGEGFRLGHGTEEHVRHPKVIETLYGKRIIDVSVGLIHCMAVTDDGEVYCWGRNDQGQLGDIECQARAVPTIVSGVMGKGITGIACGPAQVWVKVVYYDINVIK